MAKTPFRCRTTVNKLPVFWKNNVIFVANILSIFFGNQEETAELRHEVGSIESYGGRLIPILDILFSGQKNLLILEHEPDPALIHYFKSLGLSIPETLLLPASFYEKFPSEPQAFRSFVERLREHPASHLCGYVIDEKLLALSEMTGKELTGSRQGCRRGNNKMLLHRFIQSENFLSFDTLEAGGSEEIPGALDKLRRQGYRYAVIKAPIGASGIGMYKIDLQCSFEAASVPDYVFYEGPAMVQGWLDENVPGIKYIASPSVQLFVEADGCAVYDITEQILSSDSIHEGNIAPPPCIDFRPEILDQMIRQAHAAGAWLAREQYAGTASVDFHAVTRDGKTEVRICEINARVTGATYPSVLAKHFLPSHHWLMRNVRFSPPQKSDTIMEKLRENGLLFTREKPEGVLPFNFNTTGSGEVVKGQFIFLSETRERVQRLLDALTDVLKESGRYDRD